jgi:hypothetical protein
LGQISLARYRRFNGLLACDPLKEKQIIGKQGIRKSGYHEAAYRLKINANCKINPAEAGQSLQYFELLIDHFAMILSDTLIPSTGF